MKTTDRIHERVKRVTSAVLHAAPQDLHQWASLSGSLAVVTIAGVRRAVHVTIDVTPDLHVQILIESTEVTKL